MSQSVSSKVSRNLEELRQELLSGFYAHGSAFLSNRAIAKHYGVSCQTAHCILTKLSDEGLIIRKEGSGSNVVGASVGLREAVLVFSERTYLEGTFGWQLRTRLEVEMDGCKFPLATWSLRD